MKNFLADVINPDYILAANDFINALDAYQVPRSYYVITNLFDGFRFGFLSESNSQEVGDVIIHHSSNGFAESYNFPWDEGDITQLLPEDMAIMIHNYYYNNEG